MSDISALTLDELFAAAEDWGTAGATEGLAELRRRLAVLVRERDEARRDLAERLAVNVGLIAENDALRRKLASGYTGGHVKAWFDAARAAERDRDRLREALEEISRTTHAARAFGDGCVGPVQKVRVRGTQPPEYREIAACPACFAASALAGVNDGE